MGEAAGPGSLIRPRWPGILDHVPELTRGVTEAYAGITVEVFERAVRAFFDVARHPVLGVPYVRAGAREAARGGLAEAAWPVLTMPGAPLAFHVMAKPTGGHPPS